MVAAATVATTQARVLVSGSTTSNLRTTQARVLAAVRISAVHVVTTQARIEAAIQAGLAIRTSQARVLAAVLGRVANPVLRVWTFTLDGHDFYVLRLGDSLTLVYDLSSEEWVEWADFQSATWRAQFGVNWAGGQGLAAGYGSNVVAGDDTLGLLWFLDPTRAFDENPDPAGAPLYFERIVMGQVALVGREVLPCFAVWLTTDMGAPAYFGAGVTLSISDDAGVSFDDMGLVTVTQDQNSPELAWYSLGQISAPGRLLKIVDDGAIARIDALEMNDPEAKSDG